MIQLSALNFNFPLDNPVLLFALLLFIILFTPIVLNKIKIPQLIGLILAGALIGPHGFNLMLRDSSIVLFGTVGLLYIMFLAGLEIDMGDFKKNSGKSFLFGMYTFLIPMGLGTVVGYYFLEYSLPTSVLLASMFASHTLISYPIVSKLGIAKNRAVNITVGGTVVTDTLALLVLAIIVGMSTGEITNEFWTRLSISVVIFALIVMLVFPIIGRWFFKRYDDNISQYIFVLGMVFLASFLAEAAGIEAIIGAFLAGLALNRLIPLTSPLMNRIEFVGNALFIPFFLIGVGMLIDYQAFFKDFETIKVAITMTVIALGAKFIAAWLTQKTFKFSADERRLIFGLSSAQAAATLAAVLVGYEVIIGETATGEPIRLINESILNGTILMILITCTVASFVTQKGATNLTMAAATETEEEEGDVHQERILIPVSNIENTEELVNLSVTVKSEKNKKGLYALNIITNTDGGADKESEKLAKKVLNKATVTAAATDNELQELLRYDLNISNAISGVAKEHKITDLILGLHIKKSISESFLGSLTEGVLAKCNTTTLIYKPVQPMATIKRHVIAVPPKAEKEIGFPFWLLKVWNLAKNTGATLKFYGTEETLKYIKEIREKNPIEAEFEVFSDWNEFLILSRDVKQNDNLLIVMSRKEKPSYNEAMSKIPNYLNKYFQENNFILIYPMQAGVEINKYNYSNPSMQASFESNITKLENFGKTMNLLFKKNKK